MSRALDWHHQFMRGLDAHHQSAAEQHATAARNPTPYNALDRTLRFTAKVDEVRAGGRRVLTSAQIVDDDGEPVAVGRAVMVDLAVPAAPRASAGGGGHGSPAQPSSPLANRRPRE